MFPKECVELGCTYTAPMTFNVCWTLNSKMMPSIDVSFADIPIMIKVSTIVLKSKVA